VRWCPYCTAVKIEIFDGIVEGNHPCPLLSRFVVAVEGLGRGGNDSSPAGAGEVIFLLAKRASHYCEGTDTTAKPSYAAGSQ
jgi:hypothetical protein